MNRTAFEIVVVGGGPAGLTAAIALAGAGLDVSLVSKRPSTADTRTTALLAGSVAALETLGVWPLASAHAAPLTAIRIIDDTSRLIRAPEVRFDAHEIGLDAFGQNIENRHLVAALDARAASARLDRIEAGAVAVETRERTVAIRLDDGRAIEAQLVIGADGRGSLCRAAAGIDVDRQNYPQAALTLNLRHSRRHDGVSTEFHTEAGPFTLVPLPGQRSSLVCVVDPSQATQLSSLDDAALSIEIERRSHSILGKVDVEPGRGIFPLGAQTAHCFAADRIALIGEAAHVLPPLGAQGLNLGLRDAAAIGELVAEAHRAGTDIGAPDLLARYHRARRLDVTSRTIAVDAVNRSLLTDFLPVQGARGLGLYLIDRIGPLRQAVMREGIAPTVAQPRLMRGEAL